ncbi:MAG: threonine synthase [Gammaproteobacteria bacterium]|nr:threonine synthase [Gammaproteobacteria bacterium]
MTFTSTRDANIHFNFSEAVLAGLSAEGGLFVPESIPVLDKNIIADLTQKNNIHALGEHLLKPFIPDISSKDLLDDLVDSLNFPIPLVHLHEQIYLLEVFHGPTLAFKDVGARFMARIVSRILRQHHQTLDILVATSGDTGSAVAAGFFNVPNVRVHVLYPQGRITHLQEQQMATYGGNIFPLEVQGSFDDCQYLVKTILQDKKFAQESGLHFSTANSINIARLLPQLIYHAWGILQLQYHYHLSNPILCVPSGNFGNLVAAIYAHAAGLPVQHFIAATNKNAIVPNYLATGQYQTHASLQTYSSAMDVGHPSNFERLQYFYHDSLPAMREAITALPISDEQTLEVIRRVYRTDHYLADPHTAVGIAAAEKYLSLKKTTAPIIVTATAHPAKFPEVVRLALGDEVALPLPPALEAVINRPKTSQLMPATLEAFKSHFLSITV